MVHARRHSAVWHTPADKHCTVYACRHSAHVSLRCMMLTRANSVCVLVLAALAHAQSALRCMQSRAQSLRIRPQTTLVSKSSPWKDIAPHSTHLQPQRCMVYDYMPTILVRHGKCASHQLVPATCSANGVPSHAYSPRTVRRTHIQLQT
jgi:hypothetical protein